LTPIIQTLGRIRNEWPRPRRFGRRPRQYGYPGWSLFSTV
jgi:hypothetical protein